MRFVDRYRFLSSILGGIQDKSKIRTREGFVSFTETDTGVTVRTDQGNTYEGSIIVGADGVHSETRKQLAALTADTKMAKTLSNGFKTRCKSHVFSVPVPRGSEGCMPQLCMRRSRGPGNFPVISQADTFVSTLLHPWIVA